MLEGQLTFQLQDELIDAAQGELVFAARGVPHALANRSTTPARFVIVFTPAGFERELARRAAARAGVQPPAWALKPIPDVVRLGPPLGQQRRVRAPMRAG